MRKTARPAFTVVGTLLLVMAMALPASAKIEFHRIVYDPPGADTGSNSHLNQEIVVLHNTGSRTRRIGNWRIHDLAGTGTRCRTGFGSVLTGTSACTAEAATTATTGTGEAAGTSGTTPVTARRSRNAVGTVIDRCAYAGGGSVKNC